MGNLWWISMGMNFMNLFCRSLLIYHGQVSVPSWFGWQRPSNRHTHLVEACCLPITQVKQVQSKEMVIANKHVVVEWFWISYYLYSWEMLVVVTASNHWVVGANNQWVVVNQQTHNMISATVGIKNTGVNQPTSLVTPRVTSLVTPRVTVQKQPFGAHIRGGVASLGFFYGTHHQSCQTAW